MKKTETPETKAIALFKKHGGVLQTSQAQKLGIHPRTIYQLKDNGELESLSRGVYRLIEVTDIAEHDFITIAHKIPSAVIGLISALHRHELTTQIPHEVHVLLKKGARKPRIDYPPIRFFWVAEKTLELGVNEINVNSKTLMMTNPERTVVDCFRFRNKIGMDVCLEALKLWYQSKNRNLKRLLDYAVALRVIRIIRPYLEALS